MKRRLILLLAVPLLVALAAGVWLLRPARLLPAAPVVLRPPAHAIVPGRTNVVVVIGCTFRADQTTPYGGPSDTTPFLAEMAADGTRFATTIAQAPWTRAGITALLASRYAVSIDVVHEGTGFDASKLAPSVTTLAERFDAAGYRTVGGTANPNANAVFGFDQGFDHYHEATGLWKDDSRKAPGEGVVDAVLANVGDGSEPLYLQALLVDAHFPYEDGIAWHRYRADAPTRRVAQYRAMLRHLDDNFRRLRDGLAERGYDESNTVFVVIGDHGEGLYLPKHHGKAHGNYLYPSTTHVPWIVRGPGVARGHVVEGLSAQLDLVPTLLGLLDLPADEGSPGRDLSALLDGSASQTGTQRVFTDTWFRSSKRSAVYTDERFCQKDYAPDRTAREAVKNDRSPAFLDACFDWKTDRDATIPVEDAALMAELDAWRDARLQERERFRESDQAGEAATVDASTQGALRELGYIE